MSALSILLFHLRTKYLYLKYFANLRQLSFRSNLFNPYITQE